MRSWIRRSSLTPNSGRIVPPYLAQMSLSDATSAPATDASPPGVARNPASALAMTTSSGCATNCAMVSSPYEQSCRSSSRLRRRGLRLHISRRNRKLLNRLDNARGGLLIWSPDVEIGRENLVMRVGMHRLERQPKRGDG